MTLCRNSSFIVYKISMDIKKLKLVNVQTNKLEEVDKDSLPELLYYGKYRLPTEFYGTTSDLLPEHQYKILISKIQSKIPLYSIHSKNVYLINNFDVYDYVTKKDYRLVTNPLVNIYEKKLETLKKTDINKITSSFRKIELDREIRKLELFISFIGNYDLKTLEMTYYSIIYNYTNEVGKNLTLCVRPSFDINLPHIRPYYLRDELINLALNMELIKPDVFTVYSGKRLIELCKTVSREDIPYNVINQHYQFILKTGILSCVKYYSLQGSYFINKYLRSGTHHDAIMYQNIIVMWKSISKSPSFDKNYIAYRFIKTDDHLKHLKPGDIYVDNSFISTTRDPFYQSTTFGLILIKIKIPKSKKGVALLIESVSQFPNEQEILFPPLTKLKLESVDKNIIYYNKTKDSTLEIKKKYEFTYVGHEEISIPNYPNPIKYLEFEFFSLDKPYALTLEEKIINFSERYANELFQFGSYIGNAPLTVIIERYTSTTAYKRFYKNTTTKGFAFYSMIDTQMSFYIEIGTLDDISCIWVNYVFKFVPRKAIYSDKDFLRFISSIAYYFEIDRVIIYGDYSYCFNTNDLVDMHGTMHSDDIFKYLKFKKKRFVKDNAEDTVEQINSIKAIDYTLLEKLFKIELKDVPYKKDEVPNLHIIYTEIYIKGQPTDKLNLGYFYIWLVENYCGFNAEFVILSSYIYPTNNPFLDIVYDFDYCTFLKEENIIHQCKTIVKIDVAPPQNNYRL